MQITARTDRGFVIDYVVDSDIRSRNFAGHEKRHPTQNYIVNGEGRRNFLLFHLPDELVAELQARGCEVKYSKVNNPNDVPVPYVSVQVSYFLKPVSITTNANGQETVIDESHAYLLDSMDFSRMAIELDFGKKKQHKDGTEYTPIFASTIYAFITPNYFAQTFGAMASQSADVTEPDDDVDPF